MPSFTFALAFFLSVIKPPARPPAIDEDAIAITSFSFSSMFFKILTRPLGCLRVDGIFTP